MASKKLFRRRAWYPELSWYEQIVLADDEEAAEDAEGDGCLMVHQPKGAGQFEDGYFDSAGDVEEISPDDLGEEEARDVAVSLAASSEREQLGQMTLEEVREWLKRRLRAEDEALC